MKHISTQVLCGQMLLHLQTSRFPKPNNQSSESENHCCSKRRKQGVGIYWQEKIIERRSTNEARMAGLINVTLFAWRSILNVIYLNESVCSRKLEMHPVGRLACTCVPSPTSANTHPHWSRVAHLNGDNVDLCRLINGNTLCSELCEAAFETLSKEVLHFLFQWHWFFMKITHWQNH